MYERESHVIAELLANYGLDDGGYNFYVAGGTLTSVFSHHKINDLDLFFLNRGDFFHDVKKFKEDNNMEPSFTTDNAVSFKMEDGFRIQFIEAQFGEPAEVIANFDFTICMGAYLPKEHSFIFGPDFFHHLAQRRLCYNIKSGYPIASLWRLRKFMKRGYKIPAIDMIKLTLRTNEVEIETYGDLRRQLMGVDTLFLKELTDALEKKKDLSYDFSSAIDYMQEVLDKKLGWENDN